MTRIVYSFDEMRSTAQTLTTQADDLRRRVEEIWKQLVTITGELPSPVATSPNPNLASYFSAMIAPVGELLALREQIATHLAAAAAAAEQCEDDSARSFGHGRILAQ